MPKIDDTLDEFKMFLIFDLKSGYWQVEIYSKDETAKSFDGSRHDFFGLPLRFTKESHFVRTSFSIYQEALVRSRIT